MTREPLNFPAARSWRDIPQPIVPRAMSRGGRWRLTTAVLRGTGVVCACATLGWGVWLVTEALRENTRAIPAAAKAGPMKLPELRTDGVLDAAWLARTLALPKNASLMELDLLKLRARVLAEPQVLTATLTRNFPDRLVVQITERSPVARVMAAWESGVQQVLLVARDGTVFAGSGYDPTMLETLPWLDGIAITRQPAGFKPIAGMEVAAELLAAGRLDAEHLYQEWNSVSLARLASDRELEVRTKNGITVVFTAKEDFFRQLAKLNFMWDKLVALNGVRAHIDLTLGQDVPVTTDAPDAESNASRANGALVKNGGISAPGLLPTAPTGQPGLAPAPVSESAFFVLPSSHPNRKKREL